jgi:glycosyltransferase involved in cell wall biosynthesis
MAVGRPVVATAGGGVPEIVRDGETGVLVPLDAPRRMAEAIRMLLDDPEHGQELGARAQLDVRQRFAADRFADRIQAIYERVAAPTGGRRARAVHPGR